MSNAPHDFAAAYREIVLPHLRVLIIQGAAAFARGEVSYPEIISEVMTEAFRRGAGYLAEEHFDALHDGILVLTAHEIDAAEQCQDEADALVKSLLREPSREIIRHAVRDFLDG